MNATKRKVLTMLHDHKISVDEAQDMIDALEVPANTQQKAPKVDIIGKSTWVQEFRKQVSSIGNSDSPVLIQGEEGTGKEMLARMVHANSQRAAEPFLALNCATILASDLFGTEEEGRTVKQGSLDLAKNGTLTLDLTEVLSPEIQSALHSFLRNGYFTRVGGVKPIYADVRLIGLSHDDLKQRVDQGLYRSDLYDRLSICIVSSPPLRERPEDIEILANAFIEKQTQRAGKKSPVLSSEALEFLMGYHWPRNIRQLARVMEQVVNSCETGEITAEDIKMHLTTT